MKSPFLKHRKRTVPGLLRSALLLTLALVLLAGCSGTKSETEPEAQGNTQTGTQSEPQGETQTVTEPEARDDTLVICVNESNYQVYAADFASFQAEHPGLVSIARIELGLVRVQVGGNSDSFYLLPAWTVYGWTELNETVSIGSQTENGEHVPDVLLCINAIDGSVIDISKGY